MNINDAFFENTIFVITSIQEAEGLAILAQDHKVKYCVLLTYIDYLESYLEVMKVILKRTKIEHTFILEMWMLQRYFDNGSCLLKKISLNQKSIKMFNDDYFNGKLFLSDFNIVCNKYCPLINLIDYDKEKIYIMEHCPADSFSLRKKGVNSSSCKKDEAFLSKFRKVARKLFRRRAFKAVENKIVYYYLMKKYPLIFGLNDIRKRFSWAQIDDQDFYYLDARKYILPIDIYNRCIQIGNEHGATLLLIDHPKQFVYESKLYEEVRHIDYIDVYKQIVRDHIQTDEVIVYKLHPYIYEVASLEEIRIYQKKLESVFREMGYKKVHEFNSIISDSRVSRFPVECFIKPLSISKIVGMISSVMDVVREWNDDIELIEDLRFVPFMKKLWKMDYEGMPLAKKEKVVL